MIWYCTDNLLLLIPNLNVFLFEAINLNHWRVDGFIICHLSAQMYPLSLCYLSVYCIMPGKKSMHKQLKVIDNALICLVTY